MSTYIAEQFTTQDNISIDLPAPKVYIPVLLRFYIQSDCFCHFYCELLFLFPWIVYRALFLKISITLQKAASYELCVLLGPQGERGGKGSGRRVGRTKAGHEILSICLLF